ncbi:insulin-like growth factor-binding protein 2 isoform X2 [Hirundo rustica]|uniref:insulin-like growth factor-binding protein 2 isoform X2 n=1 Tax=Hirundo rustica TaxID=43150 RepID=UPI001A93CC41|nr:insulin-like growth factor-binding protein 2 isoform X2 [Hirundo rustica]
MVAGSLESLTQQNLPNALKVFPLSMLPSHVEVKYVHKNTITSHEMRPSGSSASAFRCLEQTGRIEICPHCRCKVQRDWCLQRCDHPVLLCQDNGDDRSESILAENHVDGTVGILSGAGGRKPMKTGMKELAVMREKVNEQQRQMGKVSKAHHNHEDSKKSRLSTGRTPCQQELDQVLERISTMRLPDERGPLEHLYSLHIPNCDKHGLYNLKQCKMSVNGQRGECWCVDPIHGKVIQGAPTIRGDPECHLFYTAHEQEDRGAHALRSQ